MTSGGGQEGARWGGGDNEQLGRVVRGRTKYQKPCPGGQKEEKRVFGFGYGIPTAVKINGKKRLQAKEMMRTGGNWLQKCGLRGEWNEKKNRGTFQKPPSGKRFSCRTEKVGKNAAGSKQKRGGTANVESEG